MRGALAKKTAHAKHQPGLKKTRMEFAESKDAVTREGGPRG